MVNGLRRTAISKTLSLIISEVCKNVFTRLQNDIWDNGTCTVDGRTITQKINADYEPIPLKVISSDF
jgi:hypothetical protein